MSRPRLKISHKVIERLTGLNTRSTGFLFGLLYDGTLLVLGFHVHHKYQLEENEDKCHSKLTLHFPTEVELCGAVVSGAGDSNLPELPVCQVLQEVQVTDNPVLLACSSDGVIAHRVVSQQLVRADYEVVSAEQLWGQFLHVRVRGRLPLCCEMTSDALSDAVSALRRKVLAGALAFHLPKSGVYLAGDAGLAGLSGDPSVGELLELSADSERPGEGCGGRGRHRPGDLDILPVSLLLRQTRDAAGDDPKCAPVIHHVKRPLKCLRLLVPVDTLAMVSRGEHAPGLYAVLVNAVGRSLELAQDCLQQAVAIPEPWHFLPAELGHFVTATYPRGSTEDSLVNVRQTLHAMFALPMDRPQFRRANHYLFRDELPSDGPLINPHEGLAPPALPGAEVSLVRGRYAYHHYQQDRADDSGWGCAYRSLQTIVSWFRLQGYTEHPVPSHSEIQRCLVALGDKPSSFVGSRQWIGSTEVSFCLDSMLGVTSRILSVNSGEELGGYGGELAAHFASQGTPIMVGGGALAHTLLGVAYCKLSGDMRFLVLDPHYTGAEDLSTVQGKGWVGWKTVSFWNKSAFYNLCMPQRPLSY